jgi:hypothetical protein
MSEDAGDQSLDSVHVDTLLKARQRCGEKPATTVRIFERNDFYYFFEKVRTRLCRSPKGSVLVGIRILNHVFGPSALSGLK